MGKDLHRKKGNGVGNIMHLGVLFPLSKISFFLCKYVICCIIFRSNEINCLYDVRASIGLGSWSFSSDGTIQTNHK